MPKGEWFFAAAPPSKSFVGHTKKPTDGCPWAIKVRVRFTALLFGTAEYYCDEE
jgi:hypothetical protein